MAESIEHFHWISSRFLVFTFNCVCTWERSHLFRYIHSNNQADFIKLQVFFRKNSTSHNSVITHVNGLDAIEDGLTEVTDI